jgi:hypothetical protein
LRALAPLGLVDYAFEAVTPLGLVDYAFEAVTPLELADYAFESSCPNATARYYSCGAVLPPMLQMYNSVTAHSNTMSQLSTLPHTNAQTAHVHSQ